MSHRNWTREELLLALNLYCKLPFGKYHSRTPEVQQLANIIGRTPAAVAMKLANFASLDSTHKERGVCGLKNASKADVAIWNEFTGEWGNVAIESEEILEKYLPSETTSDYEEPEPLYQETEKEQVVKVRRGQRFFRNTILGNYDNRCCVCGLPVPELLIASHIIPWSHQEEHRLNPQNGLCLCRIHDGAFDKGYITIGQGYHIIVSDKLQAYLPSHALDIFFVKYQDKSIQLPDKFIPSTEFTEYHRLNIFQTQ